MDSLLALQNCDARIREMEKRLRDIPARKAADLERLKEHEESLASASEALKTIQAGVKNAELEVESKNAAIAKLRQQQLGLKTNKEFQAVESEIATLQAAIKDIEERELVLMEDIEKAKADFAKTQESLQREKQQVDEDLAVLDARSAGISKELEAAYVERKSVAAAVDPEKLSAYERLGGSRRTVVVRVEDGNCGGCHMKLPPYVVHGVVGKSNAMITCVHCGRMLY